MSRLVAFGCLIVGSLLALGASNLTWWQTTDGRPPITGHVATGGMTNALSLAALAGTGLMLLTGRIGKRVVSVLIALLALGLFVVAVVNPVVDESTWQGPGWSTPVATSWHWVVAGAALVILTGAIVTVWRAGSWPTRTRRFDRRHRTAQVDLHDSQQVWQALDAGLDPTDPTRRADSPEVDSVGHNGTDHTHGRSNP